MTRVPGVLHVQPLAFWLSMSLMVGSHAVDAAEAFPPDLPAWQCSGDTELNVPISRDFSDFGQQAGYSEPVDYSLPGWPSVSCNCPEPINSRGFFTSILSLPEEGGWMRLNENLSARVSFYISGSDNVQAPFFQVPNLASVSCDNVDGAAIAATTGTKGQVEFRVEKGILGESRFTGKLADLYMQFENALGIAPDPSYPYASVYGDFLVTSTASCTFRAGDTFTVDLGSVPMNQLKVGAPPESGYMPREIDLSVDCTGLVDGDLSGLEYFASATGTPNVDGPYIATNKPGIGVAMIASRTGELLWLGRENSIIQPFSNGSSEARVKFYPTMVPGQEGDVTPGPYSATMIVTVTIP